MPYDFPTPRRSPARRAGARGYGAGDATTERGTLKMFNADRGFGFIRSDNATLPDCFVDTRTLHAAGLADLQIGNRLEYERVPDRKGFKALRPRLV